ncbi:MAG: tetratricopeptide repeat protein [Promethearchaeia archaeon]
MLKDIYKRKQNRIQTYKVNEFLTLKLINKRTYIYVDDRLFLQCKYLLLNIPLNKNKSRAIDSIDEAAERLDNTLEKPFLFKNEPITPEMEFWGHCSNLDAWAKYDYDTRILHRNLAFPLLRKLTEAGDPKARKIFKEEVAKRLLSEQLSVITYLINEGYLEYFNKEELETILETNSKENVWTLLGIAYTRERKFQGAEHAFQLVLKKNPDYKNAYRGLGKLYVKMKEYAKASNAFKKYLELEPDSKSIWFQLGEIYKKQEQYENAIDAFKQSLEIDPRFEAGLCELAFTLRLNKQFEKAIKKNLKALDIYPKDKVAWNNLSWAYNGNKQYEKAFQSARKALELDPHFANPYNHIGFAHFRLKNYKKALRNVKKAIAIDENYGRAWKYLGLIYEKKQSRIHCISAFERYLELNPNDVKFQFKLGKWYYKLNLLEEAEKRCRICLKLDPKFSEAQGLLTKIKNTSQQGKLKERNQA